MAETEAPSRNSLLYRRADGTVKEYFCERKADSYTIGHCHRYTSRPRNVDRPFRNSNDEPAKSVVYVKALRQSLCCDGRDRSICSHCTQPVYAQPKPAGSKGKSQQLSSKTEQPAYTPFMMAPERVFRDVVSSSISECLQPAVRNALLDAFTQSMQGEKQQQKAASQKKKEKQKQSDPYEDMSVPAATFPYFSYLPFEIRRMIWELAMPSSRLLLRSDLDQVGPHAEQQRHCAPDLYNTCVDARSVVNAHARNRVLAGPQSAGVSSDTRLLAGLDVLYFPWLGVNYTDSTGGAGGRFMCSRYVIAENGMGKARRDPSGISPYGKWSNELRKLGLAVPTVALDCGWIDKAHKDTLMWIAGLDDEEEQDDDDDDDDSEISDSDSEDLDGGASSSADDMEMGEAASSASSAASASSPPSLSSSLSSSSGEMTGAPSPAASSSSSSSPPSSLYLPTLSVADSSAALTELQIVVADILVPVQIHLDACTPDQRRLFRLHDGGDANRPSLRGMDFTVLVDLYDDWRINEILSLRTATGHGLGTVPSVSAARSAMPTSTAAAKKADAAAKVAAAKAATVAVQGGMKTACVNKAARHHCLSCTRRAWEARNWRKLGDHFGQRLERLCRPTIVFSVILEFVGTADEGY